MDLWLSNPKEVCLKLSLVNALKLVKEIKTNKSSSKESKRMAEELGKFCEY